MLTGYHFLAVLHCDAARKFVHFQQRYSALRKDNLCIVSRGGLAHRQST